MFAKKETVSQESPKCIKAKDVGLPYTELTIVVYYMMTNGPEHSTYRHFNLLNYTDCPTAKEAMRILYDNYLEVQNEYREQIVKNFGKYEGYMRFDNLFIRSDQCVRIYIECYDNSNTVNARCEQTPDVNGWPWEEGSYHAN